MTWEVGILLLGILFIILALFSFGRARKKQGGETVSAREHLERTRQRQGVRNDLSGLMVEIEQMAKRLGAQLDAKTIHLEKAIREADERIAQLRALRDTAPGSGAGAFSDGGGGGGAPAAGGESREDAPYALPADPHSEGVGPAQSAAPLEDLSPAADEPYTDPLTREVYALADRGQGPQSIAQSLGEHVGKVELILALRQA